MSNSHWERIWKLGTELLECPRQCKGIVNSPKAFIPSRCLFLEPRNADSIDCVVIGMNPGKIDEKNIETRYYKEDGLEYSTLYDFWYHYRSGRNDARYKGHKYNIKIRKFLNKIDIIPNDSILWTELCVCQSDDGEPPLHTFRTCISRYLNRELKGIKKNTPLICTGNTVYRAMVFRYPDRTIIGVPHPTGSFGHWDQLIETTSMMEEAEKLIKKSHKNKTIIKNIS
jgi:hypothetical protein